MSNEDSGMMAGWLTSWMGRTEREAQRERDWYETIDEQNSEIEKGEATPTMGETNVHDPEQEKASEQASLPRKAQ